MLRQHHATALIADTLKNTPLPAGVQDVIGTLTAHGFRALIVGGAVRDWLRNKVPTDFDIVTDALPIDIFKLFRVAHIVGARFQIVVAMTSTGPVEISTLRCNSQARGDIALEEDARDRDFTINGLYFDPTCSVLMDVVEGLPDLQAGVLRTIAEPAESFAKDPLRAIRGVRMAAQFALECTPAVRTALPKVGAALACVPAARIARELTKIFQSGHAAPAFAMLFSNQLAAHLVPAIYPSLVVQEASSFVLLALGLADEKSRGGQRTPDGYFIASLLWPAVAHRRALYECEMEPYEALQFAIDDVGAAQRGVLAHLLSTSASAWRSIAALQAVFERHNAPVPLSWLQLPVRRLAHDLMRARSLVSGFGGTPLR